jgi:hypothetical protein
VEKAAKRQKVTVKAVTRYLKKSGSHDFLYEALTRKLILEFGHFLNKHSASGNVFAESRRQDDGAVLRAYVDATTTSRYPETSTYKLWSEQSFKSIHTLTFQNKKGLSFGLEIADLFAWAYANKKYGKRRTYSSAAKNARIDRRIATVNKVISKIILKANILEMTGQMLKTVAGDRVSEVTEQLKSFKLNP